MPVLTIQSLTRFTLLFGCLPWAVLLVRVPLLAAAETIVAVPMMPPQPSLASTPIDFFRQLLAAGAADRERLLAAKSADHRRVLEKNLGDYETLPTEDRELRLLAMEFRFRLTSLLRTPAAIRATRLQTAPEKDQPLLAERLRIFEGLPPEYQRQVLENERLSRVLAAPPSTSTSRTRGEFPLSLQTSNQLREIERQLTQWQKVPPAHRGKLQKSYEQIFNVPRQELAGERLSPTPLSPVEFNQIQASLDKFKNLPSSQREQCIRNFARLADMSPAERRQLLADAEKWGQMKPEDRDQFRKLVQRIPPLPPRLNWPPLPPRMISAPPGQKVATN